LHQISTTQKQKTHNMKTFKFTIGQQGFTRSFIVSASKGKETFGQILGTLSFRLHQQLCLAKGSKLGKGIDLRKAFSVSLHNGNDVLLTSMDSVYYGDETSTGLTSKGQQRFGHKLAKAMYEVLLEKGFAVERLVDISEATFTLEDQQIAIRSLMDLPFLEVVECI
jgi:hypothetical protein